ncbi:hypothetical protein [Thiocystis violascens]|uniref:Uncharacterized protein n=1 Tax=Thiocystis violascens (strain ATCC 17096 / DSM 198 / 6111) TaxID=765911 RepID=I3YH77_THIV6|nr:hypothetical protein [Thiocystis violascens]AFL76345.1 hypothetical protein Thivi_4551 [Thiocystis violascens DSM 198]
MKTTIIALIFLLIGGSIGGFLALGFGMGMGAASGAVMGAQAGVCLAAETAQQQGLIDVAAQNRIISAAIAGIRAQSAAVPVEAGIEWIEDAAGCRKLLNQFAQGSVQLSPILGNHSSIVDFQKIDPCHHARLRIHRPIHSPPTIRSHHIGYVYLSA